MKIKKVIHIADIHIRTFRMHDEYGAAFKTFLKKIRELVQGYEREEIRIVIAGDYVHQKITISNELLILGTWFLRKLDKIAPVVIIAGNHDLLENNKDRVDSITPMVQLLPDLNIQYLKESKCYVDENIVWANYSIFEENARPNIEEVRLDHKDKTFIGLYHAPIMGATTDIGYEFDESTSLEHFDGCDIVMMGDIHKRSVFNYKGCPIVYPSSLIQQNFGETIDKHGFLWWDIEDRTFEEFDIETDYGFYQFKINSLDDLETGSERLTNGTS
jgi:DNA repair exonuclease SbcCD nuclease subunit